MKKIKLLTDSTCDLSEELLKQNDIGVIPLYVNLGEESFQDGVDLSTDQMYDLVEKHDVVPKTAAASPGDFETIFRHYLKKECQIIYLGIGSKFSATFQNALIAKNMLNSDDIHLIDSHNLSSGSGLLLLKASRYIKDGDGIETVVEKVTSLVPKVRSQFIIDTLDYLHKGGRLKAISALVGTMLRVKPIIRVIDGEMAIGKKPRGKLKNGIKIMFSDMLKDKAQLDGDFVMITHSQSHENAGYIKTLLQANLPEIKNIHETEAGCVISSHCGPKTIGILYLIEEN